MEPNERLHSDGRLNDRRGATYCNQCNSDTVIFDMVSSEFVCSSCGCVANDKFFNIEHNGGYQLNRSITIDPEQACPNLWLSITKVCRP